MVNRKQKKANLKKGLLGRASGETMPVVEQENNVIRIAPEVDNSREAKKKRLANKDVKNATKKR